MSENEKLYIDFKTQVDIKALDLLRKRMDQLSKTLNISSPFKNFTPATDVKNARVALTSVVTELEKVNTVSKKVGTDATKGIQSFSKSGTKGIDVMTGALKGLNGILLNASLSALFFGMALQRLSMNIIKSSITAFNKITTGGEESSGAIAVLGVHFELLKFAIGGALSTLLEAWMPTIVEVILMVTEWITTHEELTAKILIGTAVIGSLLYILGTLGSALTGIVGILSGMKDLAVIFSPLIKGFNLLRNAILLTTGVGGLGGILIAIGLIMAVVVVLYALFKSNFGGIKDVVADTFLTIWDTVKSVAMFIWNTIRNLTDIIVGIFEGDWEKVGTAIVRIFSDAIQLSVKLFTNFAAVLWNIFTFVFNGIKDLVVSALTLPLALAQHALDALGFDEQAKQIKELREAASAGADKASLGTTTGEGIRDKISSVLGQDMMELYNIEKQLGLEKEKAVEEEIKQTEETTKKTKEMSNIFEDVAQTVKDFFGLGATNKDNTSTGGTVQNTISTFSAYLTGKLTPTIQAVDKSLLSMAEKATLMAKTTEEWNNVQAQQVALQHESMKLYGTYNSELAGLRDMTGKTGNQALRIGGMSVDEYFRTSLGDASLGGTIKTLADGTQVLERTMKGVGQATPGVLSRASTSGAYSSSVAFGTPQTIVTNIGQVNNNNSSSSGGTKGGKYY